MTDECNARVTGNVATVIIFANVLVLQKILLLTKEEPAFNLEKRTRTKKKKKIIESKHI
jgi:hypothetical protein